MGPLRTTQIRTGLVLAGLAVMLLGALVAWAESDPLVITPKDNGRTLRLPVGQKFTAEVTLEGDEQVVVPQFDPFILSSGLVTQKSTAGPQGTIVKVIYNLTVKKEGRTDLIIPVKGSGKLSKPKPKLKVKIMATPGRETD